MRRRAPGRFFHHDDQIEDEECTGVAPRDFWSLPHGHVQVDACDHKLHYECEATGETNAKPFDRKPDNLHALRPPSVAEERVAHVLEDLAANECRVYASNRLDRRERGEPTHDVGELERRQEGIIGLVAAAAQDKIGGQLVQSHRNDHRKGIDLANGNAELRIEEDDGHPCLGVPRYVPLVPVDRLVVGPSG